MKKTVWFYIDLVKIALLTGAVLGGLYFTANGIYNAGHRIDLITQEQR